MPRIMIVDDAAFMRMMIKENLKKVGFSDFVEAGNGEEAVTLFVDTKPDLTLLDITMPVKDGLVALQEIRDKDPSAKIVMCSAMGQESYVVDAIKSGASDFIVKPFQADRIISTVAKVLK